MGAAERRTFATHSVQLHCFGCAASSFRPFDWTLSRGGFSGLCRLLWGFFPSVDDFFLIATVPVSTLSGFEPVLDSREESVLPKVAIVWLEYPESLNSSRRVLWVESFGFDRLAVMFAVLRVPGRVVWASSLYSSR